MSMSSEMIQIVFEKYIIERNIFFNFGDYSNGNNKPHFQ